MSELITDSIFHALVTHQVRPEDMIPAGLSLIHELLDLRKYPEQLINDCINQLSEKNYLSMKFSRKISYLNNLITVYEEQAIIQLLNLPFKNPEPDYLSNKPLITVGSGLYLTYEPLDGIINCIDCWYSPTIINGKCTTIIQSDTNLLTQLISELSTKINNYLKGIQSLID